MNRLFALTFLMLSKLCLAQSVAFMGDSLSTGGGAHPYLALDQERFKKIFSDEVSLKPDEAYLEMIREQGFRFSVGDGPRRLHRSNREIEQPMIWFVDRLWTHFSSQYLDSEEYAWPYLVGKKLGYRDENILIAARDGEKAMHALRQVDRILDHTNGQLPEKVFVFFSGNDLCGPSIEFLTNADLYKEQMQDVIKNINLNGQPASGGTDIYFVDPVGILQIVISQSILDHKVQFAGKERTCREVHNTKPEQLQKGPQETPMDAIINLLASAPAAYCPSLISVGQGNSKMQIAISNRLNGYRKGLKELVKENQGSAPKGIRYHHLSTTKELIFQGQDMANDCFHLSLNGQMKIANAVYSALAGKNEPNQ